MLWLSFVVQTSISLPFITATAEGPKHIETNLTRAKFEELASDLLDRCRVPVQQALKDANLSVSDINEVILVGGSTRIPSVQVRLGGLIASLPPLYVVCMPRCLLVGTSFCSLEAFQKRDMFCSLCWKWNVLLDVVLA